MRILGIQKHHLSSVCYLENNKLVYFNQEERLSRVKKDSGFPIKCIEEAAVVIGEVDFLVLTGYDTHLSEDYSIVQLLKKLGIKLSNNFKLLHYQKNHHLAHAANAFYNSGFEDAVIVVWDGRGSCYSLTNGQLAHETTTVFSGQYPNNFKMLYKRLYTNKAVSSNTNIVLNNSFGYMYEDTPDWYSDSATIEIRSDFDLGTMYHAMSVCLDFDDEGGKMLGLSAYGHEDQCINSFINTDGIFDMTQHCFDNKYRHIGLNWNNYRKDWNTRQNLAYRTQKDLELYGLKFIDNIVKKYNVKNLIITGGVGLNVVANNFYRKNIPSTVNLYVEPMCGDESNCIGIAKYAYYKTTKSIEIKPLDNIYLCGGAPTYNFILRHNEIQHKDISEKKVAELVANGNIVAIFQGKAEAGPRALGNRSLIFDPRLPNGKSFVNYIKGRESFRPLAASVIEELSYNWFEFNQLTSSPFMMYALDAKDIAKNTVPGVIHIDGTCRVQTVSKTQNLVYYNIINEFYNITGVPMVMNTSFNLGYEPIVHTVHDAINSCKNSQIKLLYLADIKTLIKFP